jgi:proteasome accessory factor B
VSDKLERLLNLTAALIEAPRPLTAQELRARIPGFPENDEAFRRGFERDKEDLREMGIPLVVEPITHSDPPQDGYRIRKDDYFLRDPGLEPEELAALHLASNAVRLDGVNIGAAIAKLGGTPDGAADDGVAIPAPLVEQLPASPALVSLFDAVGNRRSVTFGYRGETRHLNPFRLDYQRGRWYVSGFDLDRADERVFRLDRIDGDIVAGPPRAFKKPATDVPGIRRQAWELGGDTTITARLLVDADQAAWAAQTAGDELVEEWRADGSVVLRLDVGNLDAFLSFALGFLEFAEILDPPELRSMIIERLEAMR